MAIYFAKDTGPAAQLAQGLGTGLGQGLQNLAHMKMQEMQQRKLTDSLKALKGFSPEEAQAFPMLAQQAQAQFIKQKMQAPTSQYYGQLLSNILGGGENISIPEGASLSEKQYKDIADLAFKVQKQKSQEEYQKTKQDFLTQEKLEPFLKGLGEDYTNAKKIYSKAKGMLENLKKNKAKWPGVSGYLPSAVHRDPDIRKYIADANTLVTLLASSRKGQPTNYKVRLEQMSKPELSQPYETQVQLLEELLKDSESVFNTHKSVSSIKKEHGGKFPRDLRQRLIEQGLEDIGQSEEKGAGLPDPATMQPNTIIRLSDGTKMGIKNGKWEAM